jgi:hypothetical protein
VDQIIASMHDLGQHSFLEQCSWVAQIIIALVAIPTVICTAWQLGEIKKEGAHRTAQMKATFLFELDKMFESEVLVKARSGFAVLQLDVEDHVRNTSPHLSSVEKSDLMSEEFAKRLHELRSQQLQTYLELMGLCGFFETAGMLIAKNYIDRDDILELYDGAIANLFMATRRHIEKRQEEMPPGYLENFKKLAEGISSRKKG